MCSEYFSNKVSLPFPDSVIAAAEETKTTKNLLRCLPFIWTFYSRRVVNSVFVNCPIDSVTLVFCLFRCVHSSVQPLRSVGRSNFDKAMHNLTTLIQKSTYINESCYIV